VTTILVVEDEPDIRDLIRLNLELEGFAVVTAADGDAGLDAARESTPDLIILDVMMPGLDGWEVLAELKAGNVALARVPVLMLTARASDMDRVKGGIEGAVRYLTKPFNPSELKKSIIDVLSGEPEPVQRRQAQQRALADLARIEGGGASVAPGAARPRLSRLDGAQITRARVPAPSVAPAQLDTLSAKQRELIAAVAGSPTVSEAADRLEVSRSNVYASLRRIARKLGVPSVSDLVAMARQGGLS
jgi:DNA-binding response OmpR family regulator/DNA-binding CsgD family transcriptional regulator